MKGYATRSLVTGVEVWEHHDTQVDEEAGERSSRQRFAIWEVVDAHFLELIRPGIVKLTELQIQKPESRKEGAKAYNVADLVTVGRDDVGDDSMSSGIHCDVLDSVRQMLQDCVTPCVLHASTDFDRVNVHRCI